MLYYTGLSLLLETRAPPATAPPGQSPSRPGADERAVLGRPPGQVGIL